MYRVTRGGERRRGSIPATLLGGFVVGLTACGLAAGGDNLGEGDGSTRSRDGSTLDAAADHAAHKDARTHDAMKAGDGHEAGPLDGGPLEAGLHDGMADAHDAAPGLTVSGTITGLTSAGLVLQNLGDAVMPPALATTFAFAVEPHSAYAIIVSASPATETCSVLALGRGVVNAMSITGVTVACVGTTLCSPSCGLGSPCSDDSHCASQQCSGGFCQAPDCAPTCSFGDACEEGADCESDTCTNGKCAVPACAPSCENGVACAASANCRSGNCDDNICVAPDCAPICSLGDACNVSADCASMNCANGKCAAPTCGPHCGRGSPCNDSSDCASKNCESQVCVPPSCSPTCDTGDDCEEGPDCSSNTCTAGKCVAPACAPTCATGVRCSSNTDCQSHNCDGVCQ